LPLTLVIAGFAGVGFTGGAGAQAEGQVGYKNGVFHLSGKVGAALGLGAGAGGSIQINTNEIAKAAYQKAKAIKAAVKADAKAVAARAVALKNAAAAKIHAAEAAALKKAVQLRNAAVAKATALKNAAVAKAAAVKNAAVAKARALKNSIAAGLGSWFSLVEQRGWATHSALLLEIDALENEAVRQLGELLDKEVHDEFELRSFVEAVMEPDAEANAQMHAAVAKALDVEFQQFSLMQLRAHAAMEAQQRYEQVAYNNMLLEVEENSSSDDEAQWAQPMLVETL